MLKREALDGLVHIRASDEVKSALRKQIEAGDASAIFVVRSRAKKVQS
jgi:hypothetical protein